MNIPTFFFGLPAEVKRRSQRAATALKRGATLAETVGAEVSDTRETDALIVLDGPSPLVGGNPQFCMYALCRAVQTLDVAVQNRVHQELLSSSWGVLALQGQLLQPWLSSHPTRLEFLRACLRDWDDLESEGVRYSAGMNTATTVWGASRCIYYALANEGAPSELLQEYNFDAFKSGDIPRHEGGLRALLERAGIALD